MTQSLLYSFKCKEKNCPDRSNWKQLKGYILKDIFFLYFLSKPQKTKDKTKEAFL